MVWVSVCVQWLFHCVMLSMCWINPNLSVAFQLSPFLCYLELKCARVIVTLVFKSSSTGCSWCRSQEGKVFHNPFSILELICNFPSECRSAGHECGQRNSTRVTCYLRKNNNIVFLNYRKILALCPFLFYLSSFSLSVFPHVFLETEFCTAEGG